MIDDLYSNRILALAANMPGAGRLAVPQGSAERIAKLCGSRILVDVVLKDGLVSDFAQQVQACALGQASAAVLGANVLGASLCELEAARDSLKAMLKAHGPLPTGRFADLAVLAAVRDYPARHASTMLAFEAAVAAVQAAERTPLCADHSAAP
jgi:NifU-like protein involved in Fe-S cluster formation